MAIPVSSPQTNTIGVTVQFAEVSGVKLRYQIVPIHVDKKGQRVPFEAIASTTHDRIIGVFLTSSERGEDKDKSVMDSQISLTIDNEEILPDSFDCSLITSKVTNAPYDNPYMLNERADGSLIKGNYTASNNVAVPAGGYDVKLYLWSTTKPKSKL